MIITCNCGLKKFSLPDNSIPEAGRMVQCGTCGLKWKQFPVNEIKKSKSITSVSKILSNTKKIQPKTPKIKKATVKKTREISLYSPEYLAKKHGIKLSEGTVKTTSKIKTSFGFYNSILLFLLIIIVLSRGLYFFQDFVVETFPFTEFYIDYFFENIRNVFEIWKNLISSY